MKIRVLGSVLVGGVWHEPGVGNYDPDMAQQLIDLGVAEPFETKVVEPEVKKARKTAKKSGASQPAPASQDKTPKKRGRPRKSSQ